MRHMNDMSIIVFFKQCQLTSMSYGNFLQKLPSIFIESTDHRCIVTYLYINTYIHSNYMQDIIYTKLCQLVIYQLHGSL